MKRFGWILRMVILVFVVVFNVSFTSIAYTEEQKAQAKAWLSAHGYSPDMGGANQAYQDYLNGKFDEELGVDVNGDGIPATTQTTESSTEENTEEATETDLETEAESTEEDVNDVVSSDETTDNLETGITVDEDDAQSGQSSQDETVANQADKNTEVAEEGETEETGKAAECGMENQITSESTLYQSEKRDEYQEGLMVIVLAVILMLLAGLFMKGKQ